MTGRPVQVFVQSFTLSPVSYLPSADGACRRANEHSVLKRLRAMFQSLLQSARFADIGPAVKTGNVSKLNV